MKRLLLFAVVTGFAPVALGATKKSTEPRDFFRDLYKEELPDGHRPTGIEWTNRTRGGWRIDATEQSRKYPLTYLFDNDPRTAWVAARRPAGISLRPLVPLTLDSIALMNGYNRSAALFKRNNRVVKLVLWINERPLKTVQLSDKMGWHRIRIPRQEVRHIAMEFSGIVRGRDNDICISEIALFNGKQVNLSMPQAVLFDAGNAAGDAPKKYEITTRSGAVITPFTQGYLGMGEPLTTWSPNGRYISAARDLNTDKSQPEIFVVDSQTRKVIWRKSLPASLFERSTIPASLARLDWKDNRTVQVVTAVDFDEKGYRSVQTRCFRVR